LQQADVFVVNENDFFDRQWVGLLFELAIGLAGVTNLVLLASHDVILVSGK
jgi:hypothetical protein